MRSRHAKARRWQGCLAGLPTCILLPVQQRIVIAVVKVQIEHSLHETGHWSTVDMRAGRPWRQLAVGSGGRRRAAAVAAAGGSTAQGIPEGGGWSWILGSVLRAPPAAAPPPPTA